MAEQKSSIIVRPLSSSVGCRSPWRTAISKNGSSITLLRRTHAKGHPGRHVHGFDAALGTFPCPRPARRMPLSAMVRVIPADRPQQERLQLQAVRPQQFFSRRLAVRCRRWRRGRFFGQVEQMKLPIGLRFGLSENVGQCRPVCAARGGGVRRSAPHLTGAGWPAGGDRRAAHPVRTVSPPVA